MIEVIAEWGQSCRGNLEVAKRQAAAAKAAGCTWSKWQAFDPTRLASRHARRYWDPDLGGHADQLVTFTDNGMLLPGDWANLGEHCRTLGIGFMCTPFDLESVKVLVGAGIEAFKIASGDITYQELVDAVGVTGLPVFLSTGASTGAEIVRAINWLSDAGSGPVTLLACDLEYPATSGANLARIATLKNFGHRVGYSDHTLGSGTAAAAVGAGAMVLEKHATLASGGDVPDDRMALTPFRLALYVDRARTAQELIGSKHLVPSPAEAAARAGARRSAYATQDLPAGHTLRPPDVAWLRPCPDSTNTIEPYDRDWLFNRRHDLINEVKAGDPIGFEDLL